MKTISEKDKAHISEIADFIITSDDGDDFGNVIQSVKEIKANIRHLNKVLPKIQDAKLKKLCLRYLTELQEAETSAKAAFLIIKRLQKTETLFYEKQTLFS